MYPYLLIRWLMTFIYFVVSCSRICDESTRFYYVSCGQSARQRALLSRLHDLCDARGWFCALRSVETQVMKDKIAESLGWTFADILMHTYKYDLKTFVASFETGLADTPAPLLNHSTARFLSSIDSRFYLYRCLRCSSSHR